MCINFFVIFPLSQIVTHSHETEGTWRFLLLIAHHIWLLHIHIHSHHRVGLLLTHHGRIIELHLLGLLRWHTESRLVCLHLRLKASHHRSETGSGTLALALHHAEASTAETTASGW